MGKKILFDYHFKAVNLSDFEMILDFKLEGKLAGYARTGIVKAIKQKTGKNVGRVDVWEEIPSSMLGFVNMQAKSFIKTVSDKELAPDGISIIHHTAEKGEYLDNGKEIMLKLKIGGQYKNENQFY